MTGVYKIAKVSSKKVLLAGAVYLIALVAAFPIAASAGGDPANPAAGFSPTLQEQTSHWNSHQWAVYNAKISKVGTARRNNRTGALSAATASTPINHTLNMGSAGLQHETPDYYCGPATISEMYSHWAVYGWAFISQAQAASDMGTNTDGTTRGAMVNEANIQKSNPYVWTNVGPGGGGTQYQSGPADLQWYTADDIGNWNSPVGYNIETFGSHGYQPPKYKPNDFKHYFPGVAYTASGGSIAVNDPWWPSQDWYSNLTLWLATDNFTGFNGAFVPNQVLY